MPGLKAVLDTNVLISVAFAQRGSARELRELIAEGAVQVVTSAALLAELLRVLHYPRIQQRFHPTEDAIAEFVGLLLERAEVTPGQYHVQKIAKDPSDDMFLACALEGHADYIVSCDPYLLNLKHFQGTQNFSHGLVLLASAFKGRRDVDGRLTRPGRILIDAI